MGVVRRVYSVAGTGPGACETSATPTVRDGATVSQFTYGSDGLRRASNVNGTIRKYMLDNGMMVRETDANGVSQATYLAGLRGPEYRRDDVNGAIKWYIFDGLGSVLAEMDGYTGALTASRKLDVYGAPRATQGTPSSKHAFVGNLGHTNEPDTGGLVYMRARWMDPVTGRLLSEDPARDGANWFGYCGSSPASFLDPSGCSKVLAALLVLFTGFFGIAETADALNLLSPSAQAAVEGVGLLGSSATLLLSINDIIMTLGTGVRMGVGMTGGIGGVTAFLVCSLIMFVMVVATVMAAGSIVKFAEALGAFDRVTLARSEPVDGVDGDWQRGVPGPALAGPCSRLGQAQVARTPTAWGRYPG